MYTEKNIKAVKIGYIIMSIALCILGATLIVKPQLSMEAICYAVGIVMVLYGILKVIGYFSRDLYRLAFQFDLALGLLTAVVGIIMILHPIETSSIILLALGIIILAEGLFKIQMAIDARHFGLSKWWLIALAAIITSIFSLMLIFSPFDAARVILIFAGIALIFQGILNLLVAIYALKVVKHQKPDFIDVTYEYKEDRMK
ncbi:MAG: HdeD family acid-resistance protein [Clostridiaceae bacterium]